MNVNIKDGYELEFIYDNVKYTIELYDFIEFIRDYYTDDMIENTDGICDMIEYYAGNYDLTEIIRFVEELDINDIRNYEYFIIDCCYYYITPVNDFYDLAEVYDLSEVIEEIANDIDHLEYYCDKV